MRPDTLTAVVVMAAALALASGCGGDAADAGPPRITIIKPTATAPFDRTFDWDAVKGATTYRVVLFTADREPSFEIRDLKTTSVALSADVVMPPGSYYWKVMALNGDETIVESPMIEFVIK